MRIVAALLLLLVACGGRSGDELTRSDAAESDAPSPRETALPSGAPVVSVAPAVFAAACVAGDPTEGSPWRIERIDSALVPLAFNPIETLASRDSAWLAARIARAVDVLPSETSRADFRGIPVVVRAAWRLVPAPGDTVVAAVVARRLPMESNPLEELFFVVASPGQRQGVRDPLVASWVFREVATEETSVVRELLAVFAAPDAITLVLAHDDEDGVRTELLSRRAGSWSLEWSGRSPACTR